MRTIRIILAAGFLLGGIALTVVTWAMFSSPPKKPLLLVGDIEIAHWMVTGVLTLILLAASLKAFPGAARSGRRRRLQPAPALRRRPQPAQLQPAPTFRRQLQPAPTFRRLQPLNLEVPRRLPRPTPTSLPNNRRRVAEQKKQALAAEHDLDDDEGMSLELKEKMKRLVNLEQKTITEDIARELVIEYYPDLAEIIYRIDDTKSLETFTRHIIGIARIRLKLSDKHLADDQFSIFQRRLFDAEDEEVLKMYAPADQEKMSDVQKPFYGKAVDERHWEKLQRTLRAEGEDWSGISVKNAKNLLSRTGKRQ